MPLLLPPPPPSPVQAGQLSFTSDVPHVLLKEYERQLTRKRKERMGQLEALLAGPPEEVEARTVKGLVPSVDGRPARGGVVLELRKLRLMDFQTVLRNAVRGGGGKCGGSVGQIRVDLGADE